MPYDDDDDDELVGRARWGDRAAMNDLYRRYAPMIMRAVSKHVHSDDLEDLVDEVFETFFAQIKNGKRVEKSVPAFLWGIAKYKVYEYYRRKKKGTELREALQMAPDSGSHAPDYFIERRLRDAIEALPEDQREVLELVVADSSYPEIAELLDMTARHAKYLMQLTRKALKPILSSMGLGPFGNPPAADDDGGGVEDPHASVVDAETKYPGLNEREE